MFGGGVRDVHGGWRTSNDLDAFAVADLAPVFGTAKKYLRAFDFFKNMCCTIIKIMQEG